MLFFSTPTLDKLATRYRTDKSHVTHNFAQFYDSYFTKWRNDPVRLLEIGVGRGSSIRMWRRYFRKGKLFAIESASRRRRYRFYGAEIFIGDQGDTEFLKRVMTQIGEMDIIVDDGSHHVRDQQLTLGALLPFLKKGGYYVVEDIHTSFFKGDGLFGIRPDESNSTYKMLERFKETGEFQSEYLPTDQIQYLNDQVLGCHFYASGNPREHLTALLEKR